MDSEITASVNQELRETFDTHPRPQLHFSGLDKLWSCGEAFRRIYLDHERGEMSIAAAVGIAVDKSVNANLESKMVDGGLLPIEEVKAVAKDSLEIEWGLSTIAMTREDRVLGEAAVKGAAIDKAVRLAGLHARDVAPQLKPTHVQRRWSVEIPGFNFDLVGTIDVQEGETAVRDTKTSGKSPASGIADMSMQLTMYALAVKTLDGKIPQTVALDYLIDNKVPVYKVFTSKRNDEDFRVLMNRVENAAEIIEKGAYTPAQPTDWHCTAQFCGFFDSCRFAVRPKSVFISEGE